MRRFTNDIGATCCASMPGAPVGIRIEQPMQMDDEVAHMRVVDGLLRLGLPGGIGGGVVRIDADDVELVEILEFDAAELGQFAAEDEMQQLSGEQAASAIESVLRSIEAFRRRSREFGTPICAQLDAAVRGGRARRR